ncbi:MAG: PqqD family protein, partial [Anaerolineales bacterium]
MRVPAPVVRVPAPAAVASSLGVIMKLFNLQDIAKRLRGEQQVAPAPSAGIHHYLREDDTGKVRLHLRLEKDGSGVLLVNASRMYYLNATAAYMAYLRLEQIPLQSAIRMLTKRFHVSERQALEDYRKFQEELSHLIQPGD